MDNSKHEQLKIAKKIWELYQNGMDKSAIAKALKINRAEVTHVIKYTTHTILK